MEKAKQKTYSEKLKDPRWQKKRLEILNRDSFTCQVCKSKTKTLHVHHTYYISGKQPWEYNNESLATLCFECHELEPDKRAEQLKNLLATVEHNGLTSLDLSYLSTLISSLHYEPGLNKNEVIDTFLHMVNLKMYLPKTRKKILSDLEKELEKQMI